MQTHKKKDDALSQLKPNMDVTKWREAHIAIFEPLFNILGDLLGNSTTKIKVITALLSRNTISGSIM